MIDLGLYVVFIHGLLTIKIPVAQVIGVPFPNFQAKVKLYFPAGADAGIACPLLKSKSPTWIGQGLPNSASWAHKSTLEEKTEMIPNFTDTCTSAGEVIGEFRVPVRLTRSCWPGMTGFGPTERDLTV